MFYFYDVSIFYFIILPEKKALFYHLAYSLICFLNVKSLCVLLLCLSLPYSLSHAVTCHEKPYRDIKLISSIFFIASFKNHYLGFT